MPASPHSYLLLALILLHTTFTVSAWYSRISPVALYPSSGKRHQLPYHPVARFKGADSRPYYPYEYPLFQDIVPPSPPEEPKEAERLSAGELLSYLALVSPYRSEDSSKARTTIRFGISRR